MDMACAQRRAVLGRHVFNAEFVLYEPSIIVVGEVRRAVDYPKP